MRPPSRLLEQARHVVGQFVEHHLATVTAALALAAGALAALSILVVTIVPRLVDGWLALLLKLAAWGVAVVLLGLAVALLVRYAPAKRPEASWASARAVLTIAGWILASVLFAWWAGTVADYESAVGALTVFLVLAAYVFTLCAIFLGGVQLDAIARAELKQRR